MIIAHIATLPERVGSLERVIGSLLAQVDKLWVMLNGHAEVPSFLRQLRNVQYEILDNSLGDAAKWVHINDEPSYCVVLDDDLIALQGLVAYLRMGLHKYGGVISLHGKRYDNRPVGNFRRNYTGNYRCLNTVGSDVVVHMIGTGCTMFDNHQVKLDNSVFEHRNMADILFSRFCAMNNIPMTVLSHRIGQFLQYIPQKTTIWNTTGAGIIQTKILNEYLAFLDNS